uniref:Sterol O-acyltransferase 2 n=1 Tax=Cynoglossus semilaevis TaxID=244447 RepID=A0A3P8VMX3_CYNSE
PQRVKTKVLEQVQDHLSDLLDQALSESVQPYRHGQSSPNGNVTKKLSMRMTFLILYILSVCVSELFEISHIRTIYHMFIAVLLIFCLSTLAVDYIDQGRCVPRRKPLLCPLCFPLHVGILFKSYKLELSVGTVLSFAAVQTYVLGLCPIHVVVDNQLPPASRFIVILEQIRFLMKSYSFMRETAPAIIKNVPKEGESPSFPTLSSYLYFLFCPTLIYRESYPR